MRAETPRDMTHQNSFAKIVKISFPLSDHKFKSDIEGKHDNWTKKKHTLLTSLAILTDVGFNATAVALALSGNYLGAGAIKSAHIIGSQTLPQPLTDLKNRIINKQL